MDTPEQAYKTWTWDVFGGGILVMAFTSENPQPSWRRRFLSKILLGSIWTKHEKPKFQISFNQS